MESPLIPKTSFLLNLTSLKLCNMSIEKGAFFFLSIKADIILIKFFVTFTTITKYALRF